LSSWVSSLTSRRLCISRPGLLSPPARPLRKAFAASEHFHPRVGVPSRSHRSLPATTACVSRITHT
jgi:hypothetical protein